jgi:hypothetical protein
MNNFLEVLSCQEAVDEVADAGQQEAAGHEVWREEWRLIWRCGHVGVEGGAEGAESCL